MNTQEKLKKRTKGTPTRPAASPKGTYFGKLIFCAVLFLFSFVASACPSFFGTYPFGIAAVASASGLIGAGTTAIGSVAGSLLADVPYSGYLALLSALLFAVRLVLSLWLRPARRAQTPALPAGSPPPAQGGTEREAIPGGKSSPFQKITRPKSTGNPGRGAFPGQAGEGGAGILSAAGSPLALLIYSDNLLFREGIVVRMAAGAIAAMFMGILQAAAGGYTYYHLFAAVASVLLSPVLIYLFYAATERHMGVSKVREAGVYAMAAIFTYALAGLSPGEFNFGYAFAFGAAILAATEFGTVRGLVTGLLCGILLEPLYAPLFALAAGVSGLLCGISSQLAVMSALTCGIGWGIYVSGFDALSRLVPPLALTAAVLLPLYHFHQIRLPRALFGAGANTGEAERGTMAEVMHRRTSRHISDLSGSMRSIAAVVRTLQKKRTRPARWELRAMCEEAFGHNCARCSRYSACYGEEYSQTADMMNRLAAALYEKGVASAAVIPQSFARRCGNMGRILEEVNDRAAQKMASLAKEDRLSVVAGDYEMMSALLGECLDYDKNEMKEDGELGAKLRRLLAYNDFRAGRITVYGDRHKRIFVNDIDLSGVRLGADDIRRLFEGICGFPLSEPEFELDGGVISMRLRSVYRYMAEGGRSSLAASDRGVGSVIDCDEDGLSSAEPQVITGEEIADDNKKTPSLEESAGISADCTEEEVRVEVTDSPPDEPSGDAITTFESDGKYYMLISDGMGSGREAALTSSVAAMFLERMLVAGASMETALKMLNRLLRAGDRECSTTIDLAEIDLETGEARFVKSGAAPSFVIRDGSLYRLQSKTVPIGIMRALDAEMIRFDVMAGDSIVMLSDGVARSFEDCPWLLDLLSSDEEVLHGDPKAAAEKIVRSAAARGAIDDITAGVVRIY